ncbi:autophagy-related protein 17 [Delphinella strobiligena]|nr:autophagy-related protein 17 [Delphinella strobiligena]
MTSPSSHQSPAQSLNASESASLERLISHFVAAKRSLSATGHVYRANEIVDTARRFVEECAVLGAKNAFLERGVNEEANALSSVRDGLDSVAKDADEDFRAKVRSLDVAHIRLQETLDRLKETVVDASLASRQPAPRPEEPLSPSSSSASGTLRTLHDFISESGHQDLLQSLRQDIDSYNAAQRTFQDSQTVFDQSLTTLAKALRQVENTSSRVFKHRDNSGQGEDAHIPDMVPDLFHGLTSQATETASLLQSLIEHYDLCSTALKHTEGGGEAARAATESTVGEGTDGMDQSLYEGNKAREPITADERAEMLTVLETDAQEVDDVVNEIRERLSEMETHLHQLSEHANSARTCHRHLAKVLDLLREIGGALSGHIAAANTFSASWLQIKEDMKHSMAELAALTTIYEGFLESYALLLKEISRRAAAEAKMKKVLDKAKREVDAMCEHELDLRKDFLKDVSDFLPRDIWPALEDAPRKWDFVAVDQGSLRDEEGPEEQDVGEGDHSL